MNDNFHCYSVDSKSGGGLLLPISTTNDNLCGVAELSQPVSSPENQMLDEKDGLQKHFLITIHSENWHFAR